MSTNLQFQDAAGWVYGLSHYLHVVGALGLFLTLGLEWTSVARLRRAETVEQAHGWWSLLGVGRRIGPATLAAILVPGLYMAWAVWGFVGWINVALGAVALMAVLAAHNGIRLDAIAKQGTAGVSGPMPAPIVARLQNPLFDVSLRARVGLVLGIVSLMTGKPDLAGSLVAIGIALAAGLAWALPAWSRAWGRGHVDPRAEPLERPVERRVGELVGEQEKESTR